ncbi:MAG: hypothetical protein H7067_17230 [Burkholderiales bacterium]|nr:hypothetical protein [Opitutaceae bacterium]
MPTPLPPRLRPALASLTLALAFSGLLSAQPAPVARWSFDALNAAAAVP